LFFLGRRIEEYNYFHSVYEKYWNLSCILNKQFAKEFGDLNNTINEQGEPCKITVNTDKLPWFIRTDKDVKKLDVKFQDEMGKLVIKWKRTLSRELNLKQTNHLIKSIYQ